MKKILFVLVIFLLVNTSYSQPLENAVIHQSNGRVGIATQAKDTLFLLACQIGYNVKFSWEKMTEDDIKKDGVEKAPVFVMIDDVNEFQKIVARIKEKKLTNYLDN